ncbi:MAG: hypothetical protein IJ253_05795, partial [Bacteroidaceae bacterium]|nr:hypothetical protein [Bacteroidaceae bacterium]
LSIFDQMVSFTGGNLTYDLVCQNLNVLSAEYYFRFVDHFLKGEVEPSLLLLNEILMKGFDAGNFIGGLASHLRDLLVSRDEQTLPLLETSDQMRVRYHEQALRCKPKFLYRAIRLCNDCDQSYRTSRNKRLQVEICLIQAAQLADDDVPGAGLGPAKILKPIFAELTAARKSRQASHVETPAATSASVQSSPSVSVQPAQPSPSASAQPVQPSPSASAQSAQPSPSASAQPASPSSPQAAPRARVPYNNIAAAATSGSSVGEASPAAPSVPVSPVATAQAAEGRSSLPKLKLRSFGHHAEPEGTASEGAAKTDPAVAEKPREKMLVPLNDDEVYSAWFAAISQLPHEHNAMAERMKSMTPVVEGTSTIRVEVNNERVADYLRQLSPWLEAFLRPRLKNDEAHIEVQVSTVEVVERIYSKPERLKGMLSRNAALREMAQTLQLEME